MTATTTGTEGVTLSGTINVGLGDITPNSVTINQTAGSDGLTFTNASHIRGNFSSVGWTRSLVKTTTTNGRTLITAVPSGTPASGQYTGFVANGRDDPTNYSFATLGINETNALVTLNSGRSGSGTYLPMYMTTGSSALGIMIDANSNTLVHKNLTVGSSALPASLTVHAPTTGSVGVSIVNSVNSGVIALDAGNTTNTPSIYISGQTGSQGIAIFGGGPSQDASINVPSSSGFEGVYIAGTTGNGGYTAICDELGTQVVTIAGGDGVSGTPRLSVSSIGGVGGIDILGNGPAGSSQYPHVNLQNTFDGTTSVSIGAGGAATGIGTTEQPEFIMYGLDSANDGFLVIQMQAPGLNPTTVSFLAGNHSPSTPTNMEFYASSGKVIIHSLEIAEKVTTTSSVSGNATLVSGTVTVSSSAVTASSVILLTVGTLGTVTVPQAVNWQNRVAGTSFDIVSADPTDTSTVSWFIIG